MWFLILWSLNVILLESLVPIIHSWIFHCPYDVLYSGFYKWNTDWHFRWWHLSPQNHINLCWKGHQRVSSPDISKQDQLWDQVAQRFALSSLINIITFCRSQYYFIILIFQEILMAFFGFQISVCSIIICSTSVIP